jgi:hypothetical protein
MHDLGKIEAAADSTKSTAPRLAPKCSIGEGSHRMARLGGLHVWFR